MGAAISYYAVFSIAPLCIILIALAGIFLDRSIVETSIMSQISDLLGSSTSSYIGSLINSAQRQSLGIIGAIVSALTIVATAISVLSELNRDLDELWQLPKKQKTEKKQRFVIRIMNVLKEKIAVFSIIPFAVFLLLSSVVASFILSTVETSALGTPHLWIYLRIADAVLSLCLGTVLFALIYKVLPNTKLPWREVLLGGMVTSILFFIGKLLIGIYLNTIASTSVYGAAGSLAILLIWIYYSSQVFFIGASFIFVYSKEKGYLKKVLQ